MEVLKLSEQNYIHRHNNTMHFSNLNRENIPTTTPITTTTAQLSHPPLCANVRTGVPSINSSNLIQQNSTMNYPIQAKLTANNSVTQQNQTVRNNIRKEFDGVLNGWKSIKRARPAAPGGHFLPQVNQNRTQQEIVIPRQNDNVVTHGVLNKSYVLGQEQLPIKEEKPELLHHPQQQQFVTPGTFMVPAVYDQTSPNVQYIQYQPQLQMYPGNFVQTIQVPTFATSNPIVPNAQNIIPNTPNINWVYSQVPPQPQVVYPQQLPSATRAHPPIAAKNAKNCSSKYRGVHWNKRSKAWWARIEVNGKREHLGYFDDEEEAAAAYDSRAKELWGEKAQLNFSEGSEGAIKAANRIFSSRRVRAAADCTSRYRGVHWHKGTKAWLACIRAKGKNEHLGYFSDEISAARAYDARALELRGQKAQLNFPNEVKPESKIEKKDAVPTSNEIATTEEPQSDDIEQPSTVKAEESKNE